MLGTLGVAPVLGRLLIDDDDREGAPPVAIISDGLVARALRCEPGAPSARRSSSTATRYTIVGVAPPAFEFPDPRVRFWLPYAIPRSAVSADRRDRLHLASRD